MSKKKNPPPSIPETPWNYPWFIGNLKKDHTVLHLTPDENCLPNIADFLEIEAIESLTCGLDIKRKAGKYIFHISGLIKADITQTCVYSLQKIDSHIEENFDSYFADKDTAVPFLKAKKELFSKGGVNDTPILEEEEDPEPILNGQIDMGSLILQFLSLSINPYPYIEGTQPPLQKTPAQPPSKRESPFESLKEWKEKE